MNKVLGLGLGVTVTDEDLEALEVFYDERECPIQIELCPLVSTDLVAKLQGRGYVLKGFENELARVVPESVPATDGPDVEVLTGDRDEDAFLRATVEGFAVPDSMPRAPDAPAPEVVETIDRVMRQFIHPDIVRYLVRIDGEPAGAAASVITNGVLGILQQQGVEWHARRSVKQGAKGAIKVEVVSDASKGKDKLKPKGKVDGDRAQLGDGKA